jgi:hypothetical protein
MATTKIGFLYAIKDGPGTFDLVLALFKRMPALFTLTSDGSDTRVVHMTVNDVEAECGSCERWNLKGFISAPDVLKGRMVEAYYDQRRRSGHMTITPQ